MAMMEITIDSTWLIMTTAAAATAAGRQAQVDSKRLMMSALKLLLPLQPSLQANITHQPVGYQTRLSSAC
jgi:hypothetical protein